MREIALTKGKGKLFNVTTMLLEQQNAPLTWGNLHPLIQEAADHPHAEAVRQSLTGRHKLNRVIQGLDRFAREAHLRPAESPVPKEAHEYAQALRALFAQRTQSQEEPLWTPAGVLQRGRRMLQTVGVL